jgi:IS5 family transposase
MLIDRYEPEDVFARVPELAAQTDPVLIQLDRLLDDDQLYGRVRADLAHRYRLTLVHGRRSTPAEVLLRLLVVQHLYAWSYQETVERVADSLVLRWFCAGSAVSTFGGCPTRRRCCAGREPSGPRRCKRCWIARPYWPGRRRSPTPASCASAAHREHLRADPDPPSDR